MVQVLGCLLMLFFGAVFLILAPFIHLGRTLMGHPRSARTTGKGQQQSTSRRASNDQQATKQREKIYKPSEGEYVDFEEIKTE